MFTNAQLKKLIFPLVMEQLLAITVGMADTMTVSYTHLTLPTNSLV